MENNNAEDDYTPAQELLAQNAWTRRAPGTYDGRIAALCEARIDTQGLLAATACACRYRHYLATETLLSEGGAAPPLAIGGHALIVSAGQALILRNRNGTPLLPGGVIDAADAADGRLDVLSGIRREIAEEIGCLPSGELSLTGAFVGGPSTHVLFTAVLRTDLKKSDISRFQPALQEGLTAVELIPLDLLRRELETQTTRVSTALRAALEVTPPA